METKDDENNTNVPAAPTSITGLNVYDKYYQNADINIATSHPSSVSGITDQLYVTGKDTWRVIHDAGIVIGLQARNLAALNFNKAGLDPEFQQYIPFTDAVSLPPRPEFSLIIRANF